MISSLPIVLALGHRFAALDIEHSTLSGVAEVLDVVTQNDLDSTAAPYDVIVCENVAIGVDDES